MDQVNFDSINLKCSKHPNSRVTYLRIIKQSQDYSLLCNRCIVNNNNDCILIEINETILDQEKVIPFWPLCNSQDNHTFLQEIIEQNKSESVHQQIFQQIKDIRSKFLYELEIIEKKLQKDNPQSYLEEFYQKYSILSQKQTLINYLKQEGCKSGIFTTLSQNFRNFLNNQILKFQASNNEFDKLVLFLKRESNKQEDIMQYLQQLDQSIDKSFKQQQQINLIQTQLTKTNELILQNELAKSQIIQIKDDMKCINDKLQTFELSGLLYSKKYYSCHQHILTFTDDAKRNYSSKSALCDLCYKEILYSWNCKKCKFDLCVNCQSNHFSIDQGQNESLLIKRIKSTKTFICHQHPLEFTDTFNRNYDFQFTQCFICQQQILFSWHCSSCSFDLCYDCSIDQVTHPKLGELITVMFENLQAQKFKCHQHRLSFYISDLPIKCNLCVVNENENYFIWKCNDCYYNICLKCSIKNDKFSQELNEIQQLLSFLKSKSYQCHQHQLKLTHKSQRYKNQPGSYTSCDFCNQSHIIYSWHCPQCKYDLCLDCSKIQMNKIEERCLQPKRLSTHNQLQKLEAPKMNYTNQYINKNQQEQ